MQPGLRRAVGLRTSLSSPAHLGPLQISASPDSWPQLNAVLPPATYPCGPGVADSSALPRPSSCPDLAAAAAGEAGKGGRQGSGGGREQQPTGGENGSLFSFRDAYPGATQDPLRRASISVAAWQAAAAAAHAPGSQLAGVEEQPGGSGGIDAAAAGQQQGVAEAAATSLRRRSMSDALRSKPRPAGGGTLVQRAQQRRFDPTPVEFGSSPRSRGSRGGAGSLGSGARRAPAPSRPPAMGGAASDFDDARWVGLMGGSLLTPDAPARERAPSLFPPALL